MTYFENLYFANKIILSLLKHTSVIRGRTRLQKLAFLFQEEQLYKNYLHFKSHKFGPYSTKLTDSFNSMILDGLLEEEILKIDHGFYSEFTLTKKGQNALDELETSVDNDLIDKAGKIYTTYGNLSYHELLQYVYQKFPEYTSSSKIKDQIEK